MHDTSRLAKLASLLGLSTCLLIASGGCASTTVHVDRADAVDFSAYRSWGWQVERPPGAPALAPAQQALADHVAREIASEMKRRGFAYAGAEADLLVTPELRIRRKPVVLEWARPDRYVPSFHATPSFIIEGETNAEIRYVESTYLEISLRDRRRGDVVFRARMRGSYEDAFEPHIGSSVATLLDTLPAQPDSPLEMPRPEHVIALQPEPPVAVPRP